jgi:hypothetical protein
MPVFQLLGLLERHFGAAAAAGYYAQHSLDDPELAPAALAQRRIQEGLPPASPGMLTATQQLLQPPRSACHPTSGAAA